MKSRILPLLLLICLFSSLMVCDDFCCLQDGTGNDCTTLLCGLFSKESDSSNSVDLHSAQMCVSIWNTPVIAPYVGLLSHALIPIASIPNEGGQLIVQPGRPVYHPPTA